MSTPPTDAALASALASLGGDARAFLVAAFRCAARAAPFPEGADVVGELARLWGEAQSRQEGNGRGGGGGGAAPAPAEVAGEAPPAQADLPAKGGRGPAPAGPTAVGAAPAGPPPPASADSADDQDKVEAEDQGPAAGPTPTPAALKPNAGNGADLAAYSWTQTLAELVVTIPLAGSGPGGRLRAADCDVAITRTRLRAGAKGGPPTLDGPLAAPVQADECVWSVVDGRALELTLAKVDAMRWWGSVVEGGPAIDTAAVEPESSKLGDLDGETRATVEKMMWDQRQKALGLPTSEEAARADALRKFMAAHPEMDFSQAKIG